MADLALKLKFTADGQALVGETRSYQRELKGVSQAANDVGASVRGAFGTANVTAIEAHRRAVRGLGDDMGAATSRAREAQRAAADYRAELGHTGDGAARAMAMATRFGVAAAAALSAERVVRYADAWSTVEGRLKLVTSGTTEMTEAQRRLFEVAQDTHSGFENTVELYGRLTRSTQSLGVSQQQLLRVTETVNKAVQIGGGSAESSAAALLQLAQAMAAGVLRGDELNSVMEQSPRLAQVIAEGMGVSVGRLKAMGEAGAITAEAVFKALSRQADTIDTEFAKLPATVGASLTNVQNALLKWVGERDRALGATAAGAAGLQQFAASFDQVAQAALLAGGAIGSITVARNVSPALEAVRTKIDDVRVAMNAKAVAAYEAANAEKVAAAQDLLTAQATQRHATEVVKLAQAQAFESSASTSAAARAVAAAEAQLTAARAKRVTATNVYALNAALREEAAAEATLAAARAEATAVQQRQTAALQALRAEQIGLAAATTAVASANLGLTNANIAQAAATEALAARTSLLATVWSGLRGIGASLLALVGGPLGAAFLGAAAGLFLLTQRADAAEAASEAFGRAQEANRTVVKDGTQDVEDLARSYRSLGSEMRAVTQLRIEDALAKQAEALRALRSQGVNAVMRSPLFDVVEGNHGSDNLAIIQRFERMGLAAGQVERLRDAVQGFTRAAADDPEAIGRLVGALNDVGRGAGDAGKPVLDLARALADPALKADEVKTTIEQLKARLTLLVDPANAAAKAVLAQGQANDGAAASLARYGTAAGGVADKLADLAEKARVLKLPAGFERRLAETVGPPPEPKIPQVTGAQDRRTSEDDVAFQNWSLGESTARIVLNRTVKAESAEQVRLTREAAKAAEQLAQAQASGNPAAVANARANLDVAQALRDGVIVEADKAAYHEGKLREAMASVTGSAGEATTVTSRQARQTLELADATAQGGAAIAAAELRHRIENETIGKGAGLHSALARAITEEEQAKRKLMAAQFDRDMDMQIAAAKALAGAERDGAAAVAAAQAANQAAQQIEKEGVEVDSDRAKAIRQKVAELAKWQEQQGYNQEVRALERELQLAREELQLGGMNEAQVARILDLRRYELEIRDKFPSLSEGEIQALLRQKAAVLDATTAVQHQRAAWDAVGQIIDDAILRPLEAAVEAIVQGQGASVKWGNILKAMLASVTVDLLKMATINPLKNMAGIGSYSPSIFDLFGGSRAAGQTSTTSGGIGIPGFGGGNGFSLSSLNGTWLDRVTGGSITSANSFLGTPMFGTGPIGAYDMTAPAADTLLGINPTWGQGIGGSIGLITGGLQIAQGNYIGGGGNMIGSALTLAGMPEIGIPIQIVSSLLGGGHKSAPPSGGSAIRFDASHGGFFVAGVGSDNGYDSGPIAQASAQAVQAINTIIKAAGLSVSEASQNTIWQAKDKTLYGLDSNGNTDPAKWVQAMLKSGLLTSDDALVSKAMGNLGDASADAAANILALAKGISDASTGLSEMDKSLTGITASAKKSAAAQFDTLKDQIALADQGGIGAEMRDLATRQLRAFLDPVSRAFTEDEIAAAQLAGTMDGMAASARALGLAINDAEFAAAKAAQDEARRAQRLGEFQAALNEAAGKGYLNQITGMQSSADIMRRNLVADGIGSKDAADMAGTLLREQVRAVLKGLSTEELSLAASTLTGDLRALAQDMLAAAAATDTATRSQEATAAATSAWNDLLGRATQELSEEWRSVASDAHQAAQAWGAVAGGLDRLGHGIDADSKYSGLLPQGIRDAAQREFDRLNGVIATYRDAMAAGSATDEQRKAALDAGGQLEAAGKQLLDAQNALSGDRTAYNLTLTQVRASWDATRQLGLTMQTAEEARATQAEAQIARLEQLTGIGHEQRALLDQIKAAIGTGNGDLSQLVTLIRQVPGYQRYGAPSDVQSAWNGFSADAQNSIARRIGYSGSANDAAFNDFIVANGKQGDFEALVRGWAPARGTPFGASATAQRAWDVMSDADRAAMARDLGWQGAWSDREFNTFVVATGQQGRFEALLNARAPANDNSGVTWLNDFMRRYREALKQPEETQAAIFRGMVDEKWRMLDALPASAFRPMDDLAHSFTDSQIYQNIEDVARRRGIPGFALGGDHLGGLRMVGEHGIEIEATGPARYWSHEQTRDILSPKAMTVDLAPVVVAVGGVRTAVLEMGALIRDVAAEVAANTDAIRALQRDTQLLHAQIRKLAS